MDLEKYRIKAAIAASDISDELFDVKEKYPNDFNSLHEGFAVLAEEVDELWDEVRKKDSKRGHVYLEAKQIATVAIRIMIECGGFYSQDDEFKASGHASKKEYLESKANAEKLADVTRRADIANRWSSWVAEAPGHPVREGIINALTEYSSDEK